MGCFVRNYIVCSIVGKSIVVQSQDKKKEFSIVFFGLEILRIVYDLKSLHSVQCSVHLSVFKEIKDKGSYIIVLYLQNIYVKYEQHKQAQCTLQTFH